MEPNESFPPITIERARRQLPYLLQVLTSIGLVVLLSVTAWIFLTANSRTNETVELLLVRIEEQIRSNDDRILCILSIEPQERTEEALEVCEP